MITPVPAFALTMTLPLNFRSSRNRSSACGSTHAA
jgi:hypothetical protein